MKLADLLPPVSTTAPDATSADPADRRAAGPHLPDPDALYEAFVEAAAADGLALYPHQDEAIIELLGGRT